jgi:hypothetical protein
VTVPAKPSRAATEIVPFVSLLPAFTSGNEPVSLITKSGFAVTTRLKDVLTGADAPFVVACSVTAYVPAVVPLGTATLAVIFTGEPTFGFTVAPGVRLHVAAGIAVEQDTVTLWLKEPAAVTWKLTGADEAPRATVTLDGEGVVILKFSRCRTTGIECVTWLASDPVAFTLKL